MKNSQKKFWASLSVIALSAALFGAASMAATDNLTGYTRFKELLISSRETMKQDNATAVMSVSIAKDGTEILTMNSIQKHNEESDKQFSSGNSTVSAGGKQFTVENWNVETPTSSQYVTKNSDFERYEAYITQWVTPNSEIDFKPENMSPAKLRFMNALMDTVVGDAKNQFSSNGDTISVHLEGAQIPEMAQLLLTVAIEDQVDKERNDFHESYDKNNITKAAIDSIRELKDLRFDAIDADLKYSENMPQSGKMKVDMSGMDLNGVKHTFTINLAIDQKDVGSTKAETIDLEAIKDKVDIENSNIDVQNSMGNVIVKTSHGVDIGVFQK